MIDKEEFKKAIEDIEDKFNEVTYHTYHICLLLVEDIEDKFNEVNELIKSINIRLNELEINIENRS